MDPERDKFPERQPERMPERFPERQPAIQRPEPRIQRLGPRPEREAPPPPPPPPPPPAPAPPPPPVPPRQLAPEPLRRMELRPEPKRLELQTEAPPVRQRAMPQMPRWANWAAIALLTVAGGVLITGSDEKAAPPPEPPSVAASAETVPDQIVVQLKENTTDSQIVDLGRSVGIELRYNSEHAKAAKLMVATVNPMDRARILAALVGNPLVEAAEPQYVYHLFQFPGQTPKQAPTQPSASGAFVPNDPEYRRQWHLKMIGMEEAWAKSKGKGAIVAIIDSGAGGMTQNGWVQAQDFNQTSFVKGYDFADKRDAAPDDNGHGTHVMGTIAESTDNGLLGAGIAPEAQIMPLRVADAKGRLNMSDVADALHYAADHNANVANMSLGGSAPSQVMEKAMQYAYNKKVTLICAAGNEGREGVGYPGKFKECIAVSAVGPGGMFASYSTWGKEVDIAGPGGEPKMGLNGQVWQNTIMQRQGWFGPSGPRVDSFFPLVGTSMATPHVTGVAALLVSMGMTDPKEIRAQLRKSAKKYAPADHYGAGILDAAEATKIAQRSNKTSSNQLWLLLAAGAVLFFAAKNMQRKSDPMFFVHQIAIALAVGLFFPIVLEHIVGFGSWWNLLGHSVILSVLYFTSAQVDRTGFWRACAFTVGIVIHLLLDASSGHAPFQVLPQDRILFWMYANAAVGIYFAGTAYLSRREQAAVAV